MSSKHRVLILEDDSALANTLRQALSDAFELDITTNMADTREMIGRNTYAAVVCDLFILGDIRARSSQGGLTLIEALRDGQSGFPDWCKNVPIIAISGAEKVNGVDPTTAAIEAGANAMLGKPFDPETLRSMIDAEIDNGPKRGRFNVRR